MSKFIHTQTLRSIIILSFVVGLTVPVFAGKADVKSATAQKSGTTWRFSVKVSHGDEGWKHYANSFQILTMDGKVLGTRVLAHPHDNEQPFTRSLGGVSIPQGTKKVRVRAGDLEHGYGGKEIVLSLPQ